MSDTCKRCGCTESQASEDAAVLGLVEEFQGGIYTCCQVVTWADEQWLAWAEAAEQDGRPIEEATKPLEATQREHSLVRVRARRPHSPKPLGGEADLI